MAPSPTAALPTASDGCLAASPTASSSTAAFPDSVADGGLADGADSGAGRPRRAAALDAAPAEELCAGIVLALGPGGRAEAAAADPAVVLRAACRRLEADGGAGPLLAALLQADAPALLLAAAPSLEFEAQKSATRLFEGVLSAGGGEHILESVSTYLCSRPQVAELLLWGACDEALTFLYGELLLLGVRDTSFARVLLEEGADVRLLEAVASAASIEVKAMALACLRGLLLESGGAAPEHLEDPENFRRFFSTCHELLVGENLIVQRLAQGMLAHMLLSPDFRLVRTTYISSVRCLKLQMSLLRHPVAAIRLGAFHVFKIFVANPHKRQVVQAVLHRNRQGLVRLLRGFYLLCEADEDCSADLAAVLAAVLELAAPPSALGEPAKEQQAAAGGPSAGRPPAQERPTAPRRHRQKQELWVVDNSALKTTAEGIGYRRSPNMRDLSGAVVRWGAVVQGSISRDGMWLDTGSGRLLPTRIRGLLVLQRRAEVPGDWGARVTMRDFLEMARGQPTQPADASCGSTAAEHDAQTELDVFIRGDSSWSCSTSATMTPDPVEASEYALELPKLLPHRCSQLTEAESTGKKRATLAGAQPAGCSVVKEPPSPADEPDSPALLSA